MKADLLLQVLMNMKPFPEPLRNKDLFAKFRTDLDKELAETEYDQKRLILSAGEIAERSYIVKEGLVRGFCNDPKSGREITLFFRKKPMITMAAHSFFLQEPSDISLEAMPGTVLLSTSYQQTRKMFDRFPQAEAFAQILILEFNALHIKRSIDLRTRKPWELYVELLSDFLNIDRVVAQEALASYLGITRSSLSRLIKRNGRP